MQFQDPVRTAPVSSCFGFDRGTPVDRFYLENFYRDKAPLIGGSILEVGDSYYSRKFGRASGSSFRVLQHAALGTDPGALVGDLTDPATLPENSFDCFICPQTFQYTFEIEKAVRGAHHLLKPGGVLLATVPGISQISRYDADRYGDFWRFTVDSVTRLCQPVFGGGVEVTAFGNVLAAKLLLDGVPLEELPDPASLEIQDPDYPVIVTVVARKAK